MMTRAPPRRVYRDVNPPDAQVAFRHEVGFGAVQWDNKPPNKTLR